MSPSSDGDDGPVRKAHSPLLTPKQQNITHPNVLFPEFMTQMGSDHFPACLRLVHTTWDTDAWLCRALVNMKEMGQNSPYGKLKSHSLVSPGNDLGLFKYIVLFVLLTHFCP